MFAAAVRVLLVLHLAVWCLVLAHEEDHHQATNGTSQWLIGLRSLLEDCPVKSTKVPKEPTSSQSFVRSLAECARGRAWMAIDDILEDDVIPLFNGLELVKFRVESDGGGRAPNGQPLNASVTFNIRKLLKRVRERAEDRPHKEVGWREKVSSRVARVLSTHVIKVDIERLRPFAMTREGRAMDGEVEGRGRRRRRRQMQMMPIILMGVLLMGTVLIPMGFQFLAVLGGKALILAKMALMLSSIQGLKKIATNGVNYGLYHSPVPEPWHERSVSSPGFDVPYVHEAAVAHHQGGGYYDGGIGQFARRSSVQPT